ncbi:hypothetical protein [Lactobacillus amylolyticus]|uniref:hypothetical protein n=1 Tax=Lactobacillus amylolyticus TaxID=83683 RepID=UPI002490BDD3|nr:hypothetical protein [Lactobacillus amylolyticus]
MMDSLYQNEQNIQRGAENYDFPEAHGWYLEDEYGEKHFTDWKDNPVDEDSSHIEIHRSKYDPEFVAWEDLREYLEIFWDADYPREDGEDYLKGYLDAVVGRDNWEDIEQEEKK